MPAQASTSSAGKRAKIEEPPRKRLKATNTTNTFKPLDQVELKIAMNMLHMPTCDDLKKIFTENNVAREKKGLGPIEAKNWYDVYCDRDWQKKLFKGITNWEQMEKDSIKRMEAMGVPILELSKEEKIAFARREAEDDELRSLSQAEKNLFLRLDASDEEYQFPPGYFGPEPGDSEPEEERFTAWEERWTGELPDSP